MDFSMRGGKGWFACLLALLAGVAVLAAGGCGKKQPPAEMVRPVKWVKLGDPRAVITRDYPGRTKAVQEAVLSFRVGGPIIDLPIKIGQLVEEGDLIARIDPRDYQNRVDELTAQLDEAKVQLKTMKIGARKEDILKIEAELNGAKAKLSEAVANHDRVKELLKEGVSAQAEYDEAKANRDAAQANVDIVEQRLEIAKRGARKEDVEAKEAQIQGIDATLQAAKNALSDTYLKAPFAGSISSKYVEAHQTVHAQQSIVKLNDYSQIEIVVNLPAEALLFKGRVSGIECVFPMLSANRYPATVKEWSTEASQETQTYALTVIMDAPKDIDVLPGMTANVHFSVAPAAVDEDDFIVPIDAVYADTDGKSYAWVVDAKTMKARRVEVTVDTVKSGGILVTSGLHKGDVVVVAGVHHLKEGQEVRLLKTAGQDEEAAS